MIAVETVWAAPPDFFYYFDDAGDGKCLVDSGPNAVNVRYDNKISRYSDASKFGTGSLFAEKSGAIWYFYLPPSNWSELAESVQKMTIVLWLRPSNRDTNFTFLVRPSGDPGGTGFFSFTYTTRRLCLNFTSDLGERKTSASAPVDAWMVGEWIHLGITFEEGNVRFFVNGETFGEVHPLQSAAIPAANFEKTAFAAYTIEGNFLDDFGFFGDTALSADEIRQIYSDGLKKFVDTRKEAR